MQFPIVGRVRRRAAVRRVQVGAQMNQIVKSVEASMVRRVVRLISLPGQTVTVLAGGFKLNLIVHVARIKFLSNRMVSV